MAIRTALLAAVSLLALTGAANAAEDDPAEMRKELMLMRTQMKQMQSNYEKKINSLEKRLQTVERQKVPPPVVQANQLLQANQPAPAAQRTLGIPGIDGVDFKIGLIGTGAITASNRNNNALAGLLAGGHDPAINGFNLQSAELFIGGIVDPYFDAQATIALKIDGNGETEIELEEAFIRTRNLPWGLQIKAGQFFTDFGRINSSHVHEWAFVDQPVIASRLLGGDGLRSLGAQLNWLTPLPWYSQISVSAQRARGETLTSFLSNDGETVGPATQSDKRGERIAQMLYAMRWLNGFDLSDEISMNIGASFAFGPNATGDKTRTWIAGTDVYIKWTPQGNTRGFPFVAFQAEFMARRFEAAFADPNTGDPARQNLLDYGFYAQLLWGFRPEWVLGLRFDYATSNGESRGDPLRDTRYRVSPNLTWFPTERSKIRLQYNRDWAQSLKDGSADTVMLQFEYALGAHGAHKF